MPPATKLKPIASARTPANRLSLDYEAESQALGPPPAPIIDVHAHIVGPAAARVYGRVAGLYGVGLTYSMTPLEDLPAVADALGHAVRFIAVPNYRGPDRRHDLGEGFIERLDRFHAAGARIAKFWAAPRAIDYAVEMGDPDFMRLDAPHRLRAMERATELGMILMAHVADPDTWFSSRYADARKYGTKADHYRVFEELLDRFRQPWIAAHMGGWPEDLEFLAGLLERHPNLRLDTSATKWMVRELSRHPRRSLLEFFTRFRGRVLFGSDIVTSDEHLRPGSGKPAEAGRAADSAESAFDLYASRYWALRTLLESGYVGPSPISDPDLALVDGERYGPLDAPPLLGKHLPAAILRDLYHDAAVGLLGP
jgi:hypothetical protein